ncbi:MAG: GGDEF domain-containing protein [Nitrospirota bacterium]
MKTVVLVTRDPVLTTILERLLKDTYHTVTFTNLGSSLDYIYNTIPDVVVIEVHSNDRASMTILSELKGDPILGPLSVIALFDDTAVIPGWDVFPVDDYMRRFIVEAELLSRVELCIQRAERMVEVNPLTRLPGNIGIIRQIQKRLDAKERFALAYADLDFFKPYNDRYGFSRGDEVLKMLGRLILNTVKEIQPHGSFVGHIGGDDFVIIMGIDSIEEASEKITAYFDKIIPTFYDAEDRARGYIESVDREGKQKAFPLIGLSIGIAHNKFRTFNHYGEIAEIASEMKKYAKTIGGSCWRIDKRRPGANRRV